MRQSQLFTKTSKDSPKDEVSLNAQLLIRAGFVDKLMAGVYSYLPLGLRVLNKIQNIIRKEMNAFGGQEVLMPALAPKENWKKTGRWDDLDVLFKLDGAGGKEYALGASHEEVVTPLVQKFVKSYKDLPLAVYQIQDKFRNEARAKSGLLRGREFSMKDLYSFHRNEEDLSDYYEKSKQTYLNIFNQCGLDAKIVEATGGSFSKFSHEFQVVTEYGEDDIYFCTSKDCGRHQNKELVEDGKLECPHCGKEREVKKAIEVGNIFKLKVKYSNPFNFKYVDEDGKEQDVVMGCYGIGPSRIMGSIVEVHHDDRGIIWPEEVSPMDIHLISLCKKEEDMKKADEVYEKLVAQGKEVLYDDREGSSAGEKFTDSDLIGIPVRYIISPKPLEKGSVEMQERKSGETKMMELSKI